MTYRATAPVSARARRALDELHTKGVNFELEHRDDVTAENGWKIDDHLQPLPDEPPGEPVPGGSWEAAKSLMERYEFADPDIVRAVYLADEPLQDRNMLLEGRFYGLRFLLGLRVGGINDQTIEVDGRPVRLWGWNYRTLQGHLEMGQMDYEIWKWLDTGTVEFRIHAFSRAAEIRNPVVRLGFRVFGRHMQRRFARHALRRMEHLVTAALAERATGAPQPAPEPSAVQGIEVRPASADPAMASRLADREEDAGDRTDGA